MFTNKIIHFPIFIFGVVMLAACGNAETSKPADIENAAVKAEKSLAKMQFPELLDKITTDMNTVSTALAKVDDEASAHKAVAQIRRLAPEYNAVQNQIKALENSGDIKLAMTLMKKGPKLAQAQMALVTQMQRIANEHPELNTVFKDAADEFNF